MDNVELYDHVTNNSTLTHLDDTAEQGSDRQPTVPNVYTERKSIQNVYTHRKSLQECSMDSWLRQREHASVCTTTEHSFVYINTSYTAKPRGTSGEMESYQTLSCSMLYVASLCTLL